MTVAYGHVMQEMQDHATGASLLLSAEVMEYARISRRTLDRWVEEGRLPVIQAQARGVRRYQREDVDAVLRGDRAPEPSKAAS